MQKDLKIGLALGLALVISALIWLATRPSLSPIARMSHFPDPEPPQDRGGSRTAPTANNFPANQAKIENAPHVESPTVSNRRQDARDTLTDSARYEQTEKIKTQKFHIVLKNETLTSISQKYYGSAGKWKKIYDYNQNKIKDPNKLIPGTKLIIPE